MAKRTGLGKGLGALISSEDIEREKKDSIEKIDLDTIRANKDQPRKEFDEEKIKELAESIKSHGIIQPLILRKKDGYYEIVAGERRFRAAKLVQLEKVPAIVVDIDDDKANVLSIIENIQREDLNAVEEASSYKSLLERYKITQEELSKKIGKSRSYITNTIRLLNLDNESLKSLEDRSITPTQARSLLAIDDLKKRNKYLNDLINKKTNIRKIEKASKEKEKDIFSEDLEKRMEEALGTKVSIVKSKKGGKIEIKYFDNDDLQRLLELLNIE